MHIQFLTSLADITAAEWDALWPDDFPFVSHAYLYALESSGCTTPQSGWGPHHLVMREDGRVVGVMPLYIKTHSYGEYVFDWSWADAYHRYGRDYYPKLLSAIPFTPATGPRWATVSGQEQALLKQMLEAVAELLQEHKLSGFHCLFPDAAQRTVLQSALPQKMMLRLGCQFHWINQGFESFTHFLDAFTSRKRKAVNRERRKIEEQALHVERVLGENLGEADWQGFYDLYRLTYLKRSGHEGYLNQAFFLQLGRQLQKRVMMVKAFKDQRWVAAALYFHDSHTLFGRYWGAVDEYDGLHFECCYYQGIEFAIEHNLARFDPGAQGEHKIQRGFTPIYTASLHWIVEPPFADAIAGFLQQEREHIAHYCADAKTYLPFKEDFVLTDAEHLLGALRVR